MDEWTMYDEREFLLDKFLEAMEIHYEDGYVTKYTNGTVQITLKNPRT